MHARRPCCGHARFEMVLAQVFFLKTFDTLTDFVSEELLPHAYGGIADGSSIPVPNFPIEDGTEEIALSIVSKTDSDSNDSDDEFHDVLETFG